MHVHHVQPCLCLSGVSQDLCVMLELAAASLIHHGSSLQSVLLATTESGTLKLGTKTLSWMCWRRPTPRSTGWSGYTRWVGRSWRSIPVGAVMHHAEAASHLQHLFPRSKIWTTAGSRGHKTFPQNSSSLPDELEKVLLYFCLG